MRPRARAIVHWLVWLLFVALTLWIMTLFASPRSLANVLAHARAGWILAAVLVHVAYFVVAAAIYRVAFRGVGVHSRLGELLPVYFSSTLANAIAPAGGAAAAALFVQDAAERGQSPPRAAVGTVVVLFIEFATLLPFLAVALAFLHHTRELKTWELAAAGAFTAFVLVLFAGIALAWKHERSIERLMRFGARLAHRVAKRFRRGDWAPDEWAAKNAAQLSDAARAFVKSPREMLVALLLGCVLHGMNQLCLWTLFLAFHQPVTAGAIVAGRTIGVITFVVGVVPQGLALVEGAMALVFTSFGYPGDKVAAAVLAFRALNYWLPLVLGLVFMRRLKLLRRVLERA